MIHVDGLRKSFGAYSALDALTFNASNCSITGLVGPNGAGKTTALRLIAGLLRPDSGKAVVDGVNSAEDPIGVRRRIGALTGDLGNYPRLTSREHIRYFGELRGMSRADVETRAGALFRSLQDARHGRPPRAGILPGGTNEAGAGARIGKRSSERHS